MTNPVPARCFRARALRCAPAWVPAWVLAWVHVVLIAGLLPALASAQVPLRAIGTWMPGAIDLDGDVNPDRVSIRDEPGVLVLSFTSSATGFHEIGRLSRRAGEPLPRIEAFDIDGDGDCDINVTEAASGESHVFLNDGIGNFTALPVVMACGTATISLVFPGCVTLPWWSRGVDLKLAPRRSVLGVVARVSPRPFRHVSAPDAQPVAPACAVALPSRAPPVG